jgi:hypothetical protein
MGPGEGLALVEPVEPVQHLKAEPKLTDIVQVADIVLQQLAEPSIPSAPKAKRRGAGEQRGAPPNPQQRRPKWVVYVLYVSVS